MIAKRIANSEFSSITDEKGDFLYEADNVAKDNTDQPQPENLNLKNVQYDFTLTDVFAHNYRPFQVVQQRYGFLERVGLRLVKIAGVDSIPVMLVILIALASLFGFLVFGSY